MMKLIILDRDGVINKDLGRHTAVLDDFDFIAGSISAIVELKQAGYTIAIATNQAGVAKGKYNHQQLAAIHHKMLREIRHAGGDIDRIVYCPSDDDYHPWRKPNAGMLREIIATYSSATMLDAPIYFIGDNIRDLQAAVAANCLPVLVRTGKGESHQYEIPENIVNNTRLFDDLSQAVAVILSETKEENRVC